MSVSALWTMATEPSIVPRAVLHLHIGIDVQERTLLIVARIYGVGGGVEGKKVEIIVNKWRRWENNDVGVDGVYMSEEV